MKIRDGFVSNSSSSSFLLAWKGEGAPTVEELALEMGIDTQNPFVKQVFVPVLEGFTYVDEVDRYECEREAESGYTDAKRELKLMDRGFKVYRGSFSNEDGGISAGMCDLAIDISTSNLIIKKESGY